jgi:hypothetical protein
MPDTFTAANGDKLTTTITMQFARLRQGSTMASGPTL